MKEIAAHITTEALLGHAHFVRSLARSLVADEHGADDLYQETWARALGRPPEQASNLRGWFGVVARRLAGAERRRAVQRVAREIAERTGVPLATVRSRLQRGLAQLRERLDGEHGGEREAWCLGLVSLLASRELSKAPASTGLKLGLVVAGLCAIERGFSVRGRVVDGEGRGIMGARLWLSGYFTMRRGFLIGETGTDGRYELHDVPEARYLGVVADDFAPLELQFLPDHQKVEAATPDLELNFTMSEPAGGLRLLVLGEDEQPVAAAHVSAKGAWFSQTLSPDHRLSTGKGAALEHWTDQAGTLELRGLLVGRIELEVHALGKASWSGVVEASADVQGTTRIVLQSECIVEGRVETTAGKPAVGAKVGLAAGEGAMLPLTSAGEDGRYELHGLSEGSVQLEASGQGLGKATIELAVTPAKRSRWDATLGAGRVIVGRVIDADGKPLGGWRVEASLGIYSPWRAQGKSDAEGRFRLLNCAPGSLTLKLLRSSPLDRQPTLVTELNPQHVGEVVFRVGPDDLCDSSLRGRLTSSLGEPLPGASVSVWLLGLESTGCNSSTDANGYFERPGLKAGRYKITILSASGPAFSLGYYDLGAAEQRELGEIMLPPVSQLRLAVAGELAAGPYLYFHIDQVDSSGALLMPGVSRVRRDQIDHVISLYPGHYRVTAIAEGPFASVRLPVTIEAGQGLQELEFKPLAGRPCDIGVTIPGEDQLPERVTLTLRGADGALLRQQLFRNPGRQCHEQRCYHLWQQLPEGRYSFEAEAHDGRTLTKAFEVTLQGPDAAPHELNLMIISPLGSAPGRDE